MITIQAKDFDGKKCQASVGDILFGDFVIDTQREDGLFSPVTFIDDSAEIDAYLADLDADAWDRQQQYHNRAEEAAQCWQAFKATDWCVRNSI